MRRRLLFKAGSASLCACLAACLWLWTPASASQSRPTAVAAAQRLIEATAPAARASLVLPFDGTRRSDWHYTPRSRDGLAWKAMSQPQREATTALLQSALNERGLDKMRAVMALEIALREIETFGFARDPENYAVALYGQPGAGAWGWRIEGHHLSLHFSLIGERIVATLPQFFGANPALMPSAISGAPPRGFRLLGTEEDLARRWLASLDERQRAQAVFSARPFGDIASRNAAQAQRLSAVGLPFEAMDATQQALVLQLIAAFSAHLQPELAAVRLERVRSAPLGSIRFGWAGATTPGEPHYFRIQGASFLIEFDNSGGNHIHSVWRDFDGDFGRDVLAEHHRQAAHRR